MYELISVYDTIICGSEQIWNTEAIDYKPVKEKVNQIRENGLNYLKTALFKQEE